MRVSLYWHTLRYLRPIQFYGRLRRLLPVPVNRLARSAPPLDAASGPWVVPARRHPSLLDTDLFCFLGRHGALREIGWDASDRDALWRYNLHYFDDLNAEGAEARTAWHLALLTDWVHANPPTQGIGWSPYPTSLRIVNWLKWRWSGHTLPQSCLDSLAVQARWLLRRLEWHLLGNHLFANAKALVFAGLGFRGREAEVWLRTGLNILDQQLSDQLLADGGNFELSPMYHAIFLEDLLDLINAARRSDGRIPAQMVERWCEVVHRMLGWLDAMSHPDGEIGHFNDAAPRIAPCLADLQAYAARLGIASCALAPTVTAAQPVVRHYEQSGYIRVDRADAALLLDVAPIGPDYLPGHGHADCLSFELSLFGHRVIVNSGTSCYGDGPRREYERGTSAHSTVEVAGQNSSEVWGGFRVARRAYPFDLEIDAEAEAIEVDCSHDGYRRLAGRPVHRRRWRLDGSELRVRDRVDGGVPAVARYILYPEVMVAPRKPDGFRLTIADGRQLHFSIAKGAARLEDAQYARGFGHLVPTHCIAIALVDGQSDACLRWRFPDIP